MVKIVSQLVAAGTIMEQGSADTDQHAEQPLTADLLIAAADGGKAIEAVDIAEIHIAFP